MTKGSVQIEKCRNCFKDLLEIVVEIASLQTSFIKLHQVIKVTSRRVNALEFIVIPRFKDVVIYINQELEELAREEKFTMKKVLENKKKAIELQEALIAKKLKKNKGDKVDSEDEELIEQPVNEFEEEEEDEGLLF